MLSRSRTALPALALLLGVSLTACGGSSDTTEKTAADALASTTPTPTQAAAGSEADAKAAITDHWQAFFLTETPPATKLGYLQDADKLHDALAIGAKSSGKKMESATVTGVTMTSPTEAAVTYDLTLDGTVVLPHAAGTAVLTGATWQVSKETFCGLIQLAVGGAAVPGC